MGGVGLQSVNEGYMCQNGRVLIFTIGKTVRVWHQWCNIKRGKENVRFYIKNLCLQNECFQTKTKTFTMHTFKQIKVKCLFGARGCVKGFVIFFLSFLFIIKVLGKLTVISVFLFVFIINMNLFLLFLVYDVANNDSYSY